MHDPHEVAAYARFKEIWAVLDIARFTPAPPAAEAVVLAMRTFAARHHQRLLALNPGVDVSGFFHIRIDPEVDSGARILEGEPISFAAFLGRRYDIAGDRVLTAREANADADSEHDGLARALLSPPYGLKNDKARWGKFGSAQYLERECAWQREILRDFLREVLAIEDPRETEHLQIHRWPTDWSNYFDAGNEWWGTHAWSIADSRAGWLTVVCASASD